MKPVMLYKGEASYLCETEARLAKFKAAGWSEDKPRAVKKGGKSRKDEDAPESKKDDIET